LFPALAKNLKARCFRSVFRLMQLLAKSTHSKSRMRGFSLTELLVVIGVITILLGIILTILHGAIKAVRALKGG
jgi:prepilin-type N-terminal cleavage/methylation domain-containing protein